MTYFIVLAALGMSVGWFVSEFRRAHGEEMILVGFPLALNIVAFFLFLGNGGA